MGHWENSLQERGIPCSVGVQLNIKNPLLFVDLYCVNCLRRSPTSSEPTMFSSERPTKGGTLELFSLFP